jgi:hypothetical protein
MLATDYGIDGGLNWSTIGLDWSTIPEDKIPPQQSSISH